MCSPSKPRVSVVMFQRSRCFCWCLHGSLLFLFSKEPEEVFSDVCLRLGPRGIWAATDSLAASRIHPFPSRSPPLLRKGEKEKACEN